MNQSSMIFRGGNRASELTPRIPRRAPGISSRQRPSAEAHCVRPQQGYSQSAVHRPERARGDVGQPDFTFHTPTQQRANRDLSAALLQLEGGGEDEGGPREAGPSVSSHNPDRSFFLPHTINSKTLPRDTGWQKENQPLRSCRALRHPDRVYFRPCFYAGKKRRFVSLGAISFKSYACKNIIYFARIMGS